MRGTRLSSLGPHCPAASHTCGHTWNRAHSPEGGEGLGSWAGTPRSVSSRLQCYLPWPAGVVRTIRSGSQSCQPAQGQVGTLFPTGPSRGCLPCSSTGLEAVIARDTCTSHPASLQEGRQSVSRTLKCPQRQSCPPEHSEHSGLGIITASQGGTCAISQTMCSPLMSL